MQHLPSVRSMRFRCGNPTSATSPAPPAFLSAGQLLLFSDPAFDFFRKVNDKQNHLSSSLSVRHAATATAHSALVEHTLAGRLLEADGPARLARRAALGHTGTARSAMTRLAFLGLFPESLELPRCRR